MRVTDIIAQTLGATVMERPGDVPLILMPGAERHVGGPTSTRRAPKRIVLSEAEKLALSNLLRLMQDEFTEVEEGAGAPVGTLDALLARIKAVG